ncbi:MAG TPA: GMC family oxidoreductase [Phnomibacter sp.]|nr:GMC family oxidoreductase [Phnomibacter sp.]
MHIDARQLPDNSLIEGDICIIGTGPAGSSIAMDWMNTRYKVILLESGGFEYDDKVQDLYKGKGTGQKYYPLRASRLSYFGGTSNHWAGMCAPFDNIDFMKRDWVPHSGWPITRQDLDPYYARACEKLKLGPYNFDLQFWQNEKPNMNPFPLDPSIVWHKIWQISGVSGFVGGFNKAYKETIVNARNIHLYTYATVVNINANDSVKEITSVTVKNHVGKTHTVKARHFILAGGTIQNARMLLASNTQAPKGLGNDNDLVGRFFMEHLEIDTAEMWLLKPFPTDLFNWSPIWCEFAITEKVQFEKKITNGTCGPMPLAWAKHSKPRMETWQNEDPRKSADNMFKNWDEAGKLAEKENKGAITRAFSFQTRIEQAPNPDSRITIGPEKDELGVPRANLNWALTDLDKRSIRTINKIIGEQIGRSGVGRVRLKDFIQDENDMSWPEGTNGGWHHMGTTRMSDSPKTGVVDANCQVFGLSNLYVAGAACYTTSGAPNPTFTLVALSLRLSDFVKSKMGVA